MAEIEPCDVLVVGAGPTGLTLAAQLSAFGVPPVLVDAATDRVHESRALAVQPRTLEVLRPFGVSDELVARGSRGVRLRITAGRRVVHAPLFDVGAGDTAYPFLLFVSQAETEAVLAEHLTHRGIAIRRGVRLESFHQDGDRLLCTLRDPDGAAGTVAARWVVGCDGARSTVREQAGIAFTGGRYPQTFCLADLSADGLEDGAVNTYLSAGGPLFFFPLGSPAPWRLITFVPDGGPRDGPIPLDRVQQLVDDATAGTVHVHDPVWTSAFRVSHRGARHYRAGRAFLAGDAAHVHSPAGAQGMNTGIQDAVNLGWKLGLVCRGVAPEELLDSYDAERRPVGEEVLRFTDRAFTAATSNAGLVRLARTRLVPYVLPSALRLRPARRLAFRTVSQLGIRYRRSPAVQPAAGPKPRPGDRLPDVRIGQRWLSEELDGPAFTLLTCGVGAGDLPDRFAPWLAVRTLEGAAARTLGLRGSGWLLVRPDGHVAARGTGVGLAGAEDYLARSLRRSQPSSGPVSSSRSIAP
ncbi:FAD-dependent monooxygenase [Petropleomorpha daqingensis]|uniref:2-polyprenyl-6-methoxyphenol hydroxylase-like FAD-dependent oxidoreductase n=1 Tax=Petropleomorpha daqingensis TaxID=2026353 RepID=A0A853CAT2_9ACTN|nr:FAD-dependent monooxygenase [Petropleomorpha daqingensis]NYJ04271.1 2-polyprenyl-6-methoxyphenol hydroxylase-like FAD-dependent oxidoreductase [Petropleomorpha daqingensis]